jgi:hypothetical protein
LCFEFIGASVAKPLATIDITIVARDFAAEAPISLSPMIASLLLHSRPLILTITTSLVQLGKQRLFTLSFSNNGFSVPYSDFFVVPEYFN